MGMNLWLNTEISTPRSTALAELASQAHEIKISDNVYGSLIEIDVDRFERERAERKAGVLKQFLDKNKASLAKVARLEVEYETFRANEGGRDAKMPNKWVEFGILIPLILLPESMLNFESFRRAPIIQSDAMALGVTIMVGIGIATAAYCIGLFVRQFHYFARPDDTERPRSGWPLYGGGSAALLVTLGIVAAARYYYLLPKIQEAIVLGGPVPNIAFSIGSLLFGNLICFLVGAIFTFFLNEPNPDFAAKARDLEKAKRELRTLGHREVDKTLEQVEARSRRNKEEAKRRADQMANKPGYSQLRERFARFSAKDTEVIGVLNAYRVALVRAVSDPRFEFALREPTADRPNAITRIGPDKFSAIPLQLSRSV
jgi:hypothetical protein